MSAACEIFYTSPMTGAVVREKVAAIVDVTDDGMTGHFVTETGATVAAPLILAFVRAVRL